MQLRALMQGSVFVTIGDGKNNENHHGPYHFTGNLVLKTELKCRLATVEGKKADVWSISPSSELKTSAFLSFTVAILHFQLSC